MKTIYIDEEFKCHVSNNGTMIAVKTDYFDNKCDSYIKGYRYIPEGYTWTRSDGTVFVGEMFAPWKMFDEIDQIQRRYEQELAEVAQILLGGN